VKVIFLDIDGVLVNDRSLRTKRIYSLHENCDPSCVKALNRIIASTGAEIVVSSTWRTQGPLAEMREILNLHFEIDGQVLDCTPELENFSAARHEEITAWLGHHKPSLVESFVIIDDYDNMGPLQSRLVRTREEEGLTEDDADRAIRLLSEPVS